MNAAAALDSNRLHARRTLAALVALAATIGISTAVTDAREVSEPPLWTVLYNLGFGALTFAWVHFDSRRRGHRLSLPLKLGVLLLAAVALPWYLIRSRRGSERWVALARLAGFFLALVLAATAGYTLGYALA